MGLNPCFSGSSYRSIGQWAYSEKGALVLILVLVEVPIGAFTEVEQLPKDLVLILVLVEVPIGEILFGRYGGNKMGLNPCFSGSSYRRIPQMRTFQQ